MNSNALNEPRKVAKGRIARTIFGCQYRNMPDMTFITASVRFWPTP
jgi:hypothetical protein